jgi:hypothetical protein
MAKRRSWSQILAASVIAAAGAAAAQPTPAPAAKPPPPAESGLKNMQVLTGLFDVLPTMHVMRAALGVTCDYCHVAENGQYWRDDKPAKQRARQMIRMMAEINRANFGGRTEVTCNTCHRGSVRPVAVPAIGQGLTFDTTHAEPAFGPPPPTAAQVLDAYLAAIGGRAKLEAVKTRAVRMTVLRSVQVEANPAQVGNRGQAQLVETVQQAPDRYAYVRTAPSGTVSRLVLVGDGGWMARASQPVQSLSPDQAEQVRSEWRAGLDLGRELDWARRLSSPRPVRRDKIDGRPVWVVTGAAPAPAGASERLYFDAASGLLVRRTVLRPTQVGPDPEQTDYADYRPVEGVLLPFRITTSYLDDNHLGVTRIVASVKENVAADAKTFEPPADAPR